MTDIAAKWKRAGSAKTPFSCLSRQQLRRLARRGGHVDVSEFVSSKGVGSIGSALLPLVTPRPMFHHMWVHHTQSAMSLNAVALQMRLLHASLRWESLLNRVARGPPLQITTRADGTTITKEIAARRDLDPQGLESEYLLMVSVKHSGGGGIRPALEPSTPAKGVSRSQRASKTAANTMLANVAAAEDDLLDDEDGDDTTPSGGASASVTWLNQSRLSMLLLRQFCDLYERRRAQILHEEAMKRQEEERQQLQTQQRQQQLEKEKQKRLAEQLRQHDLVRQKHLEKRRLDLEAQQKKQQMAAAKKAQEVAHQIAAKRAKLAGEYIVVESSNFVHAVRCSDYVFASFLRSVRCSMWKVLVCMVCWPISSACTVFGFIPSHLFPTLFTSCGS